MNAPVGVYVGVSHADYRSVQIAAAAANSDLKIFDHMFGTGTSTNVIAGRVSYTLGLQGPAVVVDTMFVVVDSHSLLFRHYGVAK